MSGGVNLKLAHQSIDDYSAYGYGIDLAGRMTITEKLRAGLMLQDIIGARMKLVAVRERTPFTIRAGIAYQVELDNSPFSGTVALDLEKPERRGVKLRTGFEISHTSGLALRTGYDRDNFTLGMGLRYQQLTFDYAYKFMEHLTDSHRFSLSFDFGSTREERQARAAEKTQISKSMYLQADRQASLERELAAANAFFDAGQLDSALAAYYRADAFADAETKKHITTRISRIYHLQSKERETEPRIKLSADEIAGIIREATNLMDKGDLRAARDIIDAAIARKVEAAEIYVLRREIAFRIDEMIGFLLHGADHSFDQGDYIEAYNQYNRVLIFDMGNTQARDGSRAATIQIDIAQHMKLAMDYYDHGRYILSQREFNAVLQLDPDNETARRLLRGIDDRLRESGTQAEKDLRQDNEMWQVYLEGVEAYRAGEFKKAIELWNTVLKKYPKDKMTLENKRQAELRVKE
jgi:tetratricopeptide (TPR) repeat protein